MNLEQKAARVFTPLLKPARYKGAHGGRGSGKSWHYANALIRKCFEQPGLNAVCCREIQKSLDQSVKKLLEETIERGGVGGAFEVQEAKIKTPGGGQIIFQGLQNHTAESIKSLEGYDIAWVEEAQTLSQISLDLLRPTIRKENSEIWFSWNPKTKADPVDKFLRAEAPPGAIVVEANWWDNPWFPEVLKADMEYDRTRDRDKYLHVWCGHYQQHSQARVFHNWVVEAFESPPEGIYRFGADWGFANDPTVLVRARAEGKRLYIDYEAYMVGCEIDQTPDLFDTVPGSRKWWITADSARPETISYLKRHGYPKIRAAIKGAGSVEDGIEWLKSFDIVVHPRCEHTIIELENYSWKVDPLTDQVLPILADRHNHCVAEGELVWTARGNVPIEQVTTWDYVRTRRGYRRVLFAGVTDRDRDIVEVVTDKGLVRCTPDHEIWTSDGFIRADKLCPGQQIINARNTWLSEWCGKVRSIGDTLKASMRLAAGIFSAPSLAVHSCYTGTCGGYTTGKSPVAVTSTIRMATRATTRSTTLNASLAVIMQNYTRGARSGKRHRLNILMQSDTSRSLGTGAKRGGRSTEGSAGWPTRFSTQSRKSATIARSRLYRENLGHLIGSAPINASQRGDGRSTLTMKVGYVVSAVKSLLQIAMRKQKLVPGHVVTVREAGRSARVYDLTVEHDHEFVAGGVLVSNCIDAVRYGCEAARKATEKTPPPASGLSFETLDSVVGY